MAAAIRLAKSVTAFAVLVLICAPGTTMASTHDDLVRLFEELQAFESPPLLERTLADYAKQVEDQGGEFRLNDFFDALNRIDSIPISLARWEMTGRDNEIGMLTGQ